MCRIAYKLISWLLYSEDNVKNLDIFVNQQMLTLFEIIAHHGTYNLLYTLLSMLNMGVWLVYW